jgi:hypothetical protein
MPSVGLSSTGRNCLGQNAPGRNVSHLCTHGVFSTCLCVGSIHGAISLITNFFWHPNLLLFNRLWHIICSRSCNLKNKTNTTPWWHIAREMCTVVEIPSCSHSHKWVRDQRTGRLCPPPASSTLYRTKLSLHIP